MQMTHDKPGSGIVIIRLEGRLDREGSEAIEQEFTAAAAGTRSHVVVDLSQVTFLASIGMRTLIATAKAQANQGGRMVLLKPVSKVRDTLTTAGIDTIIPIYEDEQAATRSFDETGD